MNKKLSNVEVPSKEPDYAKNFGLKIKLVHKLFGGDESLAKTGENYLKYTKTETVLKDEETKNSIDEIKNLGKGLIISNHSSITFGDYLPLFSELGDEVLSNCVFYNGYKVIKANRGEFKQYSFRDTNSVKEYLTQGDLGVDEKFIADFSGTKQILEIIQMDINRIQKDGGYVFLIPMGEGDTSNFKGIFKRFIRDGGENMPIMVNSVEHSNKIDYAQIAINAFKTRIENILNSPLKILNKKNVINLSQTMNTSTITSRIATAGDFKGLNGVEQKQKYYEILGIKND